MMSHRAIPLIHYTRRRMTMMMIKPMHVDTRRMMCAVKELPWCAAKDSPNRRQRQDSTNIKHKVMNTNNDDDDENDNETVSPSTPLDLINKNTENTTNTKQANIISQFGIVAAMDRKTNIIGMNGKLPWCIPNDRTYFKQLTAGRILVIGKNTFYETPNWMHIIHAKYCIVLSKTLTMECVQETFHLKTIGKDSNFLHIARSFPEALEIANSLLDTGPNQDCRRHSYDDNTSYECWIAGGQRVYEEAIAHKSAKVLHLTLVDDSTNSNSFNSNTTSSSENESITTPVVAQFPAKYRWDRTFQLKSQSELYQQIDNFGHAISFTHTVYCRKGTQRDVSR
jgi:dihydrofolate reductase